MTSFSWKHTNIRMKRSERETVEAQIGGRYEAVKDSLTERARRLFVAAEAKAAGHGGRAAASRATGMAQSAIGRRPRIVRAEAPEVALGIADGVDPAAVGLVRDGR